MSRNLPLHLIQIVVYNFVKLIHATANGKQFPLFHCISSRLSGISPIWGIYPAYFMEICYKTPEIYEKIVMFILRMNVSERLIQVCLTTA